MDTIFAILRFLGFISTAIKAEKAWAARRKDKKVEDAVQNDIRKPDSAIITELRQSYTRDE